MVNENESSVSSSDTEGNASLDTQQGDKSDIVSQRSVENSYGLTEAETLWAVMGGSRDEILRMVEARKKREAGEEA